jgi:condensin complex subunit 3
MHMIARVLPVKKGTTQVDRVIKFIGGYTKFVNEKGIIVAFHLFIFTPFPAAEEAETKVIGVNDDDDALASRFTAR